VQALACLCLYHFVARVSSFGWGFCQPALCAHCLYVLLGWLTMFIFCGAAVSFALLLVIISQRCEVGGTVMQVWRA
jgi:hypothetical protein